ncbi:uncharacterized protein LY89DRAFT_572309 [Mollisia scopiformis]|uniref:Uncharacterized protein n=1 Tax=Mollisia scopiformis TaxID=149040 RepID=A0A194XWM1_MOLSC|nr:uncharacterized protein LY89DRAFT_572309 [Mollisia scopiformis]KUJ24628.1 hypothetical protein LY89DRAFT_572309 [Mollisia scopiformis]
MGQNRVDTMKEVQVPLHPIPSMQEAFAESMLEANEATTPNVPKNRPGNAAARRKLLLDQETSEETHAGRWKQRPGQQYHELWKLMAQISFGVYLLMKGMAKDDDQVMNILQGHVDEVDEFLETTLEDFDLAQEDIEERLKFLKLPLENIIIFDAMLEDRNFRLQIVSGNERIEHVITRTATAMNDALKDVQQGLDACKEFTIYLAEEEKNAIWMKERPDMQKVFDAMKGNVEGWYKAYVSLQTKGNHLGVALVQLGSIVAEMDRRAGEISRKSRFSTTPTSIPIASPPASPPQSKEMRQSMLKNLPSDPNLITPAIRATLPAFQLVQDRERTPSESSSEVEPPEPDFILKPRTYSPAPSPKPPAVEEAPPELTKRSSLRKRFSMKRKETPADVPIKVEPPEDDYWGPRQRVMSSAARERAREISIHEQQKRQRESAMNERYERPREISIDHRPRETSLNTPPSRGLDSAYCSDFEKTSSPSAAPPPNIPLYQTHSNTSRPFHQNPIPSPLSDKQFFRPVQASPNSPLQRPWTAGPSNPLHMHSNSSTSNLSQRGNYHAHTPSQLGNRRGAPSAMGMSVMSDMTMMTDAETGKKVKKKRSALGWLKKAFSLSEEEKRAFEERRVLAEREREREIRVREQERRRWVDGKRIR